MDINNAFPSKYLKCADLMGRKCRVVMERVDMDKIGEDTRMIVSFRGKEKGLVLNKTNANTIAEMYGSETDTWFGKEIILFPTRVDYQGKRVDAIRVEFTQPPPRQATPQPMQAAINTEQQMRHDERNPPPHDDMNGDSIDF